MNGLLVKLACAGVAFAVWYSSSWKHHEDGDYYVDKELDSYVEEVYLADSYVKLVPIKSWLRESEQNELYQIDRTMGSRLADDLRDKYGIELKVCVDSEFGDPEAVALVGKLGGTKDFEALAKTIRYTVTEDSTIEIGEEWLLIE